MADDKQVAHEMPEWWSNARSLEWAMKIHGIYKYELAEKVGKCVLNRMLIYGMPKDELSKMISLVQDIAREKKDRRK